MKVLALDSGMHLGFAALGGDTPPSSGSCTLRGGPRSMGLTMRHADQEIRSLVLKHKPDVIAFASPFVGQVHIPIFIGGKPTGQFKTQPIDPNSIRPLFGILAKIEEIADELKIRCVELDEPECRRAFLDKIPRKSKDIKIAIMRGCRQRGWPASDDHAGDALCVASRALEVLEPQSSHKTTPLFSTAPVKKRKRICRAPAKD